MSWFNCLIPTCNSMWNLHFQTSYRNTMFWCRLIEMHGWDASRFMFYNYFVGLWSLFFISLLYDHLHPSYSHCQFAYKNFGFQIVGNKLQCKFQWSVKFWWILYGELASCYLPPPILFWGTTNMSHSNFFCKHLLSFLVVDETCIHIIVYRYICGSLP